MIDTRRTIKIGSLRIENPNYSHRAARGCTIAAVVMYALLKVGVL